MTARSGGIEERLIESIKKAVPARRTDRNVYALFRHPQRVLVVEADQAGEAQVECSIPGECLCIDWKLGTGLFGFLQSDKNADGSLFFCRPDGSVEAHIIECKRTVDQSKWAEVLEQMR